MRFHEGRRFDSVRSVNDYFASAGNKEWSIVPTRGYSVRGGFGHSSVWDEVTQRIYVYGGYVSTLSTSASISDDLYSFDPIVRKW